MDYVGNPLHAQNNVLIHKSLTVSYSTLSLWIMLPGLFIKRYK